MKNEKCETFDEVLGKYEEIPCAKPSSPKYVQIPRCFRRLKLFDKSHLELLAAAFLADQLCLQHGDNGGCFDMHGMFHPLKQGQFMATNSLFEKELGVSAWRVVAIQRSLKKRGFWDYKTIKGVGTVYSVYHRLEVDDRPKMEWAHGLS